MPTSRWSRPRQSEYPAGLTAGRAGAQGRDRTTDTVIFSHVLYQLSYLGIRIGTGDPERRAVP